MTDPHQSGDRIEKPSGTRCPGPADPSRGGGGEQPCVRHREFLRDRGAGEIDAMGQEQRRRDPHWLRTPASPPGSGTSPR